MASSMDRWRGLRGQAFLGGWCAALVVVADWLFYKEAIGWTPALFVALMLVGLLLRYGLPVRAHQRYAVLGCGSAVAGLMVAMVLEPGPLVIVLILIGLAGVTLTYRSGWSDNVGLWVQRLGHFVLRLVAQPYRDSAMLRRLRRNGGPRRYLLAGWIGAWAVPGILAAVFVAIFSVANPIIEQWLNRIGEQTALLIRSIDVYRILFWAGLSLVLWGFYRARWAPSRRVLLGPVVQQPERTESGMSVGIATVVRSLVVLNAVFAVQTVLDLTYMTGGLALPDGMTYAKYAHRGAYPLLIAALISGALILLTFRPGGAAEKSVHARRLVMIWLGQNVFLAVTSCWRLSLYVSVYSLSRWRVAAAVWMVLVAAGLVWVGLRIFRRCSNAWMVRWQTVTALVVLYVCCFINIDGAIADFNVDHCHEITGEGVTLDLPYLVNLGPAALPALVRFRETSGIAPGRQRETGEIVDRLASDLYAETGGWRGWTVYRSRWLRVLDAPASEAEGPRTKGARVYRSEALGGTESR